MIALAERAEMGTKEVSAARAASRTGELHGNAPDRCEVALLLIDVINDFAFEGGAQLLRAAAPAARELAALCARARRAGVPCIYVNDNFGRWRSDFTAQVEHCLRDGRGGRVVARLVPTPEDYFVLKPKHSAFYQTCLELLLSHLGAKTLILGGFATESCVSFSAADAFLRGYEVIVARDATASASAAAKHDALAQLTRSVHARTPRARDLQFVRTKHGLRVRAAGAKAR